jgi:hypothetical protein
MGWGHQHRLATTSLTSENGYRTAPTPPLAPFCAGRWHTWKKEVTIKNSKGVVQVVNCVPNGFPDFFTNSQALLSSAIYFESVILIF